MIKGKVRLRRPRNGVQYNGLVKNETLKHGVKDYYTKMYWNENTQKWVCRMPSPLLRSSELLVNDFSYYDISRIKHDFGSLWEKVAFFLTQLYNEELSKGYKLNDWPFLYWDYKKCKAFLGDGYLSVFEKLENMNMITVDRRKNVMNPVKNYIFLQLNKSFIKEANPGLKTKMMINSVNEKIILTYFKRLRSEETALENYVNVTLSEININLDITERKKIVDEIVETKRNRDSIGLENPFASASELSKLKRNQSIDDYYYSEYSKLTDLIIDRLDYKLGFKGMVTNLNFGVRRSSFGNRLSHYCSNIPKELRSKLMLGGEYLKEVDIRSSQPSFLMKLIDQWFFKSEFAALNDLVYPESFVEAYKGTLLRVDGRDFYEHMASVYNAKIKDKDVTRDQMKDLFMMTVFGNLEYPNFRKHNRKELISVIFGSTFYQFLKSVNKLSISGIESYDGHKNLSALLQREEAKFLEEVMLDLMAKEVKFLPLYDSLIIKQSDLATVKMAFNETIIKNDISEFVYLK